MVSPSACWDNRMTRPSLHPEADPACPAPGLPAAERQVVRPGQPRSAVSVCCSSWPAWWPRRRSTSNGSARAPVGHRGGSWSPGRAPSGCSRRCWASSVVSMSTSATTCSPVPNHSWWPTPAPPITPGSSSLTRWPTSPRGHRLPGRGLGCRPGAVGGPGSAEPRHGARQRRGVRIGQTPTAATTRPAPTPWPGPTKGGSAASSAAVVPLDSGPASMDLLGRAGRAGLSGQLQLATRAHPGKFRTTGKRRAGDNRHRTLGTVMGGAQSPRDRSGAGRVPPRSGGCIPSPTARRTALEALARVRPMPIDSSSGWALKATRVATAQGSENRLTKPKASQGLRPQARSRPLAIGPHWPTRLGDEDEGDRIGGEVTVGAPRTGRLCQRP